MIHTDHLYKYHSPLQTISGQAVDRHLLGLKLIALENGRDIPELFMDLAFKESTHFRLSTSQVSLTNISV